MEHTVKPTTDIPAFRRRRDGAGRVFRSACSPGNCPISFAGKLPDFPAEMSVPRLTVVSVTEVTSPSHVFGVPFSELDFAVVDVETTGWSPDDARITEIGAVRVHRGQVVAEFTSLVNPRTPVPASIEQLTGINDQMLALAPPVAAVLPGLLAFAEGCVLTAHNAPFDLSFLTTACATAGLAWPGYPVLDTVRLARHLMATPDEVPDCKLHTLTGFFGTPSQPAHRALADARATADVLGQLLQRLADRGICTLGELMPWLEATDKVWRGSVPRSSGGSEWSPPSS
jgi:DNA polymerase III subunit epsilon